VLFTFNKYSLFLASLVICICDTVGLWRGEVVPVILCGCEILSYVKSRICLTSREEYRLRVYESRVVRIIFDVRGR
jgi:hypothetical protein